MAPKVTSSSHRNKRGSKPVTKGQNPQRSNRQAVSTAQVTSGSNGKPTGGGARVTNASQRTSTGSARVTGTPRAALPPGTPRPVRPSIGNVSGPATTPKAPGTNASLRPGASRTAPSIPKPAAPAKPAAKPPAPAARSVGAAVRSLSGAGRFIGAAGTAAMLPSALGDVADGFQRLANHPFLTKNRSDNKGTSNSGGTGRNRRGGGRAVRGGTTANVTPTRQGPPVPERLQNAPTPPILPAAVTRDSVRSSATSSAPSRSASTPRRSSSTSPARKASTAPTPPSERRVSASTANRESGNYGTSKTNNPLMKDLVGRMKDREDKAQSSAASKLSIKFNTDSGYQLKEKVDGSKVDTKAKISSTTSEYDKKKRRYGG